MSSVSPREVRDFVCASLADPLGRLGLAPAAVPDDLNLVTSGVIDSFGVLELIMEVNERFGLDIDFDELDPEELTVVGPFSRYVAAMSSRRAA